MVGSISVDTYLHDCLTPRADIMCLVLETKVLGAPFVLTWLSTRTQIAFSVISSYIYIYTLVSNIPAGKENQLE